MKARHIALIAVGFRLGRVLERRAAPVDAGHLCPECGEALGPSPAARFAVVRGLVPKPPPPLSLCPDCGCEEHPFLPCPAPSPRLQSRS